jgi:hypothetical protein
VGQGRSALCNSSFPELSFWIFRNYKDRFQIIDLIFAKIIIFFEIIFVFSLFFSARAYALAEVDGARASPFEILVF